MIALGIETSGRIGSVALCAEDRVLAAHTFPEGTRHARNILPAVDRVVEDAGVHKAQISAVAVSEGPGSFTGLRVGVTCAKTLACALGWKCVGVPSLEVKARNVDPASLGACKCVCPVLDARRNRVYGTVLRWEGRWVAATGVLCVPPEELGRAIPDGALLFGSGVRAYPQVFGDDRFRIGEDDLEVGRAETVARIGLERIRAGRDIDPMQLVARYYRPTAPEEKLKARDEAG